MDDKTALLEMASAISMTPAPVDEAVTGGVVPGGGATFDSPPQGIPVVSQVAGSGPGVPVPGGSHFVDEDFPEEPVRGVTVVEGADGSQVRGATDRLAAMFTPR